MSEDDPIGLAKIGVEQLLKKEKITLIDYKDPPRPVEQVKPGYVQARDAAIYRFVVSTLQGLQKLSLLHRGFFGQVWLSRLMRDVLPGLQLSWTTRRTMASTSILWSPSTLPSPTAKFLIPGVL